MVECCWHHSWSHWSCDWQNQESWKSRTKGHFRSKCQCYKLTMLQKLSKCELKEAQCWNFIIILPLRFYVKSDFDEFKRWKMSFLALLEILNFNLSRFEPFLKFYIYQDSRLRVYEIVKMALISHKIKWQITYCIMDLKTSRFERFWSIVQLYYLQCKSFRCKVSKWPFGHFQRLRIDFTENLLS